MKSKALAGIYAAAITPLNADFSIDLEAMPHLLRFFAKRGCHGALLSGTTGEGPSFNTEERRATWQAAVKVREDYPYFRLLAGTGSPSLSQTIELNKIAFDLGFEGVVTLPPFYFNNASEQGLFEWYCEVIDKSVTEDGWLYGYQIPPVSGVNLGINLLRRLRDKYPTKFGGIKDSTGDLEHSKKVSAEFEDRLVFSGNDRLLGESLKFNNSGCITAMANLISPDLRAIWDAHQNEMATEKFQEKVSKARLIGEKYQPFPISIKAFLNMLFGFPQWAVKPPLMAYPDGLLQPAAKELSDILNT